MLSGKRILLGVCGGIAAYKTANLVRLFIKVWCRSKGRNDSLPPKTLLLHSLLSTLSKNPGSF